MKKPEERGAENCPYCGEGLRMGIYCAGGMRPGSVPQFIPEEEMIESASPSFLVFARLPVGKCCKAGYCETCDRVFAEFEVLTDGE